MRHQQGSDGWESIMQVASRRTTDPSQKLQVKFQAPILQYWSLTFCSLECSHFVINFITVNLSTHYAKFVGALLKNYRNRLPLNNNATGNIKEKQAGRHLRTCEKIQRFSGKSYSHSVYSILTKNSERECDHSWIKLHLLFNNRQKLKWLRAEGWKCMCTHHEIGINWCAIIQHKNLCPLQMIYHHKTTWQTNMQYSIE